MIEYTALIVAAGSGSRMGLGYNKMLFKLKNGHTILEETIQVFQKDTRCHQIIVVASKEDIEVFMKLCTQGNIVFVQGGATRQDSVYHGLKAVMCEHVLIHDGARPWLTMDCIDRIVESLQVHDACLLMMPVKDTIKVVEDGKVKTTPQRATLYQAQTPQAFRTSAILKAYHKAYQKQLQASDDAQIMELCGDHEVYVVEGSYGNMKVTTIEDIAGR